MTVLAAMRLLRPKQWAKNLLALAAWVFTGSFGDPAATAAVGLCVLALCLVSSATYALNDTLDAERDRAHPKKKLRPVASGAISPSVALSLALICLVAGVAVGAAVRPALAYGLGIFAVLQVAYNLGLKRVPVLDVTMIALAFVLRAVLGAVAIRAEVSGWLLVCTGSLALLLGFAKRRHEFRLMGEGRSQSRPALDGYSEKALDAFLLLSASLATLSYAVYVVESPTAVAHPALIVTALPVVYGVLRYLLLVYTHEEGGEPENLVLGDPQMLVVLALFLALSIYAMAGGEIRGLPIAP